MTIHRDAWYTPDDLANKKIAAKQTLARWRHEAKGPAYVKSGARVLYLGADILDWLATRRVQTNDN